MAYAEQRAANPGALGLTIAIKCRRGDRGRSVESNSGERDVQTVPDPADR